jgi:hypothetical protein
MKTIYYTMLALMLTSINTQAQTTTVQDADKNKQEKKEPKKDEAEERFKRIKSWTFAGFDVVVPQNLKYGYTVKQGYWAGPSGDLFGFAHYSILTGYFTKQDSGRTINVKGQRFAFSGNIPFPLFKSRHLNVIPYLGIGGFSNKGSDPYIKSSGDGGGFGFTLNPGISVIVGPVKVGVSYSLDGGFAQKGSIIKGLNRIPTLSIGFSTQDLILNPTIFSHTGMKRWIENYRSSTTTTYTTKREHIGGTTYADVTYKTTKRESSWDEMRGVKTSAQIRDVRPFFFIGPRAQTNFMHINTSSIVPTYGVMSGFRCGTFYISAMYDKGNFYFKEPFKRKETAGSNDVKELSKVRLDGYFNNSTRYGGEVGLDLVTYFIRSGFESQASFTKKTSYFGAIARIGYYKQTNGDVNFISDSGSVALNKYTATLGGASTTNDVRLAPKSVESIAFGATVSFGAVAFNYDYYTYKNYKALAHSEFSLSYHLPIIRVVKAMNVYTKIHKRKKQERKLAKENKQ